MHHYEGLPAAGQVILEGELLLPAPEQHGRRLGMPRDRVDADGDAVARHLVEFGETRKCLHIVAPRRLSERYDPADAVARRA